jgi:ribosome-binding protein aMBF1 (putative translation factor)
MPEFDRALLVKKARLACEMTQTGFKTELKRTQETISRYEKGTLIPPDDVVMRCIRILEQKDGLNLFTEDEEMVQLIKQVLNFNGENKGSKRAALRSIMNALLTG